MSSSVTTKFHIQWVSDTPFSWGNPPGREANHFPLSSAEVKNEWSYLTTPAMSSWCPGRQLYIHLYRLVESHVRTVSSKVLGRKDNNNNNNNNNKLQLCCYPVAVVILHAYKI